MLRRRYLPQVLAICLLLCVAMLTGYAIAALFSSGQQISRVTARANASPSPRRTAVLGVEESAPETEPLAPESLPSTFAPAPTLPEDLGAAERPPNNTLRDLLDAVPAPTPAFAMMSFVEDTFDGPDGGWIERETPTWSASYQGGSYLLATNGQPAMNVASSLDGADYRLNVDVAVERGSAGIVFLAAKPATFYRFVISPDGTFALQRQDGDQVANEVDWTPSDVLQRPAGATYRVGVIRQGNRVECVVDDVSVLVWTTPADAVVGQYGLAVAAVDGHAAATFDNLRGERIER